jgi:hypothetical protein
MKYNEPVLNEREKTHGDYVANATLSQRLKATIRNSVLVDLSKDQRESLDLICTKIGRICTGNPNEADHWKDIAGYAELICSRLRRGKQNVVGSSKRESVHAINNYLNSQSSLGHDEFIDLTDANDERSQIAQQSQPTGPL